jgi:hypothetical protein
MIEQDTADALREAIEKLEAANHVMSGLRGTLLRPDLLNANLDDRTAIRGALVLVQGALQHANALLHSILDKGR